MQAAKLITAACAVLPVVWSCMHAVLPQSAPRNPVPVNASLARTWDAVLAIFAEQKIEVTQDTSAGTVAFTKALQLSQEDAGGEDCPNQTPGQVVRPQFVTYRVVVKGDSHSSNVVVLDPAGQLYAVITAPHEPSGIAADFAKIVAYRAATQP